LGFLWVLRLVIMMGNVNKNKVVSISESNNRSPLAFLFTEKARKNC